jgi:DNA polymerase family A
VNDNGPRTLLADLRRRGLSLTPEGAGLRVKPSSLLTEEVCKLIRDNKPQLWALLTQEQASGNGADETPADETPACSMLRNGTRPAVTISGTVYLYTPRWSGERLTPVDGYLGFDTETEKIPDRLPDVCPEVPRLALATASAGADANVIIHPDDVGAFVLAHRDLHFICHNVDFDFWVVEDHLRRRGEEEARRAWWEVPETNQLHDSMILDMLVRLARDDSHPVQRNLAVVAKEYAGLEIDKDDPYRTRYAEIIGKDWATVEEGFFSYAIKDAIVTRPAYLAIREQALALADAFDRVSADVLPDARERFGVLTEAIQVKKAIALAQIPRNGLTLDRVRLDGAEADLRRRLPEAEARVGELCPTLYKRKKKTGALIYTPTGAISKNQKALEERFAEVKEALEAEIGAQIHVPLTKKARKPTTSTEFWAEYADRDPFLTAWVATQELAKLLQFFRQFRADRVHPEYTTMVRTGRTSCKVPNVQQVPKDGPLRGTFVPSPRHLLLDVDYSFIELRTLAAVCLHRYGRSTLADVIKAGRDPHAHTAALLLDVPEDEFLAWKGNPDRADEYKNARQRTKPVNFGVPGGLGAGSLVDYARHTFNATLTLDEARAWRERLITEVYPELSDYLTEDVFVVVASSLRTSVKRVQQGACDRGLPYDIHPTTVRKILEEEGPRTRDGAPYNPKFIKKVWRWLRLANKNPDLKEAMEKQQPSKDLARRVCWTGVATLTGRIRGRVGFTQARNTPFSGLAADGAALALFALVREGFRVVAFIHDEFLVELPDEGGYVSEAKVRRVEEILCREMENVLVGGVPAGCESAVSRRWDKQAKLIVRDGKVYPGDVAPESPG